MDVLFSILLGTMAYLSYVNDVMAAFGGARRARCVGIHCIFSLLRAFSGLAYDFITLTNEAHHRQSVLCVQAGGQSSQSA